MWRLRSAFGVPQRRKARKQKRHRFHSPGHPGLLVPYSDWRTHTEYLGLYCVLCGTTEPYVLSSVQPYMQV